jgi:arsenical pump membrane protein
LTGLVATWGIAALAIGGVIVRPWGTPEAIWAVGGAALLVIAGLLPPQAAWAGVARGTDVYLFLTGMMLLAEVARREGLFDVLAASATRLAAGSGARLFTLIYLVGTGVTVLMSNDATAVVLTPAVAAVARASRAPPLPLLLICAFVANAASFVLPISNPANLVIYGSHMPPLLRWLPRYALPSLLSIAATYAMLRWTQRAALREPVATDIVAPSFTLGGKLAAAGIAATAWVLLAASALGWQLGVPTCLAGLATVASVLVLTRSSPSPVLRHVSWGVLPLVAGLFVLVQALDRTGLARTIASGLQHARAAAPTSAAWGSGVIPALLCNLMNNLPAGLIAANALQIAQPPHAITGAVLIGIDLGPNLSVTGSLATILWLTVLRREGIAVTAGAFLRLGAVVMPPALLLALCGSFVR